MTNLIILANVAVFAVMAVTTGQLDWSARQLRAWGGNLGVLSLQQGEWWRLFTAPYLHAGVLHILGNMVLLAITGRAVEGWIGPVRFLLAYTACGAAASALSAFGHPQVVSVGASGAVAGTLAILVAFYWSGRFDISGSWLAQTISINAVYSLAPNVDWLAHLGGFLAGLAIGGVMLALSPVQPPPPMPHDESPWG